MLRNSHELFLESSEHLDHFLKQNPCDMITITVKVVGLVPVATFRTQRVASLQGFSAPIEERDGGRHIITNPQAEAVYVHT